MGEEADTARRENLGCSWYVFVPSAPPQMFDSLASDLATSTLIFNFPANSLTRVTSAVALKNRIPDIRLLRGQNRARTRFGVVYQHWCDGIPERDSCCACEVALNSRPDGRSGSERRTSGAVSRARWRRAPLPRIPIPLDVPSLPRFLPLVTVQHHVLAHIDSAFS